MSEAVSFEELLNAVSVPPHMINLWTKKFPIFSPQRNPDGKITFKSRDLSFAKGLKHLLIHEKETIKAVQTLLNERGISYIIDIGKHPENYKNHNNNTSRARFLPQDFSKNTLSFSSNHKEIAKKAFSNLNNIFTSKEKNKNLVTSLQQTVERQQQKEPENTVATNVISTISNTDIPIINTSSSTSPSPSPSPSSNLVVNPEPNFEENWRTLMEKNGKAVPIEQVRDKPNPIDDDLLTDIWFIDDEINLFDDEAIVDIENLVTMPPPQKQQIHKPHRMPPPTIHKNTVSPTALAPQGLTIEQTEKIKHLIAKLDIMRDEMTSANAVITKTLKAFGYSSFENAYDKFDQKSAY